jgi:hypothetical protein
MKSFSVVNNENIIFFKEEGENSPWDIGEDLDTLTFLHF